MPGFLFWQIVNPMPKTLFRPIALVFWGILAFIVTFRFEISPIRMFVTVSFLLICPGLAFTWRFKITNLLVELVLATSLSIAIDTFIAAIMLYTHSWSLEWGLVIIICITTIGSFVLTHAVIEMNESLQYVGFVENERDL